jgi:hypothetical protein
MARYGREQPAPLMPTLFGCIRRQMASQYFGPLALVMSIGRMDLAYPTVPVVK